MRLKGRPSIEQEEQSDEFSLGLLREYEEAGATYKVLAKRHGLSTNAIFRRLQSARAIKRFG